METRYIEEDEDEMIEIPIEEEDISNPENLTPPVECAELDCPSYNEYIDDSR